MINSVAQSLLQQYLAVGDLAGFIIAVYTQYMGDVFFALILLGLSVPLYIRTQSITFVAGVWTIVSGLMSALIPTAGLDLAKIMFILGFAALIISLFMPRS